MSKSSFSDRVFGQVEGLYLPKQPRSKATYERLLAAAASIFADRGWDELSTNAVAEAAGVSIGSLYRYFPDKLEILRALAEREADRFCSAVEAALASAPSAEGPVLAHALLEALAVPEAGGAGELCYSRLMGSACSEELGRMDGEIENLIESRLAARLGERLPGLGAEAARLKAKVAHALIKGLTAEMLRCPDQQEALRTELERLLSLCLASP